MQKINRVSRVIRLDSFLVIYFFSFFFSFSLKITDSIISAYIYLSCFWNFYLKFLYGQFLICLTQSLLVYNFWLIGLDLELFIWNSEIKGLVPHSATKFFSVGLSDEKQGLGAG